MVMGKVTEFLNKVMADEAAKAEFEALIGVRKERELNDDDFQKIVELSEKLGAAVTLDEVKDFFSGNGRELSDEELAGVAGGVDGSRLDLIWSLNCPLCGKTLEMLKLPFSLGAFDGPYEATKREAQDHLRKHLEVDHRDLFGCEYSSNIADQKAEELMKPEWEKIVRRGKVLTSFIAFR